MKKIVKEFKEFAVKGNAIELATAVVVGGAFGKIVSSLVADLIMPFASLLSGGNQFSDWKITLRAATANKSASILNIGNFIQNILDFLIIAFAIFMLIKLLARLKEQLKKKDQEDEDKEAEKKVEKPSKEELLLTEIRDLLKNKASS